MKHIMKFINALIVLCFISLVVLVFMQVIFRYVLGNSLTWAEEVARFIFIWLIYLGGIITVQKGMNITFDVVLDALPLKLWMVVFTIVNVLNCAFLIIVVVLGFELSMINMTQLSSAIRMPMGFAYLAIPIGCAGMVVTQVQWYLATMKKRRAESC